MMLRLILMLVLLAPMATLAVDLPTTNLTANQDASNSDDVFEVNGNPASNVVEDTDGIEQWDFENSTDNTTQLTASTKPNWQDAASNMLLPIADFDGDDYMDYESATGSNRTIDQYVDADGYFFAVSIRPITISNTSASSPWGDHKIVSDDTTGGFINFGFYFNSPNRFFRCYHWDGAIVDSQVTVSVNTNYVLSCEYDGTDLKAALNQGAGTDAETGGSVSDLTFITRLGGHNSTAGNLTAEIGQIVMYDAALSSGDVADVKQHLYEKWIEAPSGGSAVTTILIDMGEL